MTIERISALIEKATPGPYETVEVPTFPQPKATYVRPASHADRANQALKLLPLMYEVVEATVYHEHEDPNYEPDDCPICQAISKLEDYCRDHLPEGEA